VKGSLDWRGHVSRHLPSLAIAAEREAEIVDELALQLEAAYDNAIQEGASESEAQAAALREVPDWQALALALERVEEPRRSSVVLGTPRTGGLMSGFFQDVRYACRALMKAPGFAVVATTTLALGIGATTIIYSLVDGILLRPLPIAAADRVMLAREVTREGNEFPVSWPNFLDWQKRATSFESLAAWRGLPANLTGTDRPRRLMIRQVTWNLFDVLGVRPVIGRSLTQSDDHPSAERVGLVSYSFWQRELGGEPTAIGRRITLDDVPVVVVGVLPADFTVARQEDAFLPLGNFLTPASSMLGRANHNGLAAIGRLAPHATEASARVELATIAAQLAQEYPESNAGAPSATVRPLFDVLVSGARPTLRVLLGAVLAMLLIACVNLANLLLARSSVRTQELAVRRALGAAGWRITRQLLTESVLIAAIGGALGVVLAWAGFGAVISLLPPDQPRIHTVALDLRVLLVTAGISVLTGIVFGIVPALHAGGARALSLLRTARVTAAGSGGSRTRRGLLVAEVALALMLLSAAGLTVQTMANLLAIDPGFEAARVISAQVSLPVARYTPGQRRGFYDAAIERVRAIPGVAQAAFTYSLPVQGSNWNSVFIASGHPVPAREDLPGAAWTPVSIGYHETMGIRLIRGRLFTPADGPQSTTVVVVNERLARHFWPNGDAVGQRIKQGFPEDKTPWREIVGVVADVKTGGLDRPTALQAYLPMAQVPQPAAALVVKAGDGVAISAASLEAAIHAVDPNLPVYDVRTLDEVVGRGVGQQRMTMVFLIGFAALALVMAAIGVFGVTAYSVSQRTHELGVRVALGASAHSVLGLAMRQELVACAIGVIVGLGGAFAISSLLESVLFGVTARDPLTLLATATLLLAVTAAATYLPARRAARLNPVEALRG
jgi:putative ABC transport system permease protein